MPRKPKKQTIKCEKCDREFHDDKALEYPGKVYVHKGEVLCEDCLVHMGVLPDTAEPYSVYAKSLTDLGKLGPGAGGF
ncbi:MAG: hypothetical protein HYX80_09910 [Chloroflexi bacterium]|nr:hypothetical protein [Chloroflexota bacterium]